MLHSICLHPNQIELADVPELPTSANPWNQFYKKWP
jgi:hypothetical protein